MHGRFDRLERAVVLFVLTLGIALAGMGLLAPVLG